MPIAVGVMKCSVLYESVLYELTIMLVKGLVIYKDTLTQFLDEFQIPDTIILFLFIRYCWPLSLMSLWRP